MVWLRKSPLYVGSRIRCLPRSWKSRCCLGLFPSCNASPGFKEGFMDLTLLSRCHPQVLITSLLYPLFSVVPSHVPLLHILYQLFFREVSVNFGDFRTRAGSEYVNNLALPAHFYLSSPLIWQQYIAPSYVAVSVVGSKRKYGLQVQLLIPIVYLYDQMLLFFTPSVILSSDMQVQLTSWSFFLCHNLAMRFAHIAACSKLAK